MLGFEVLDLVEDGLLVAAGLFELFLEGLDLAGCFLDPRAEVVALSDNLFFGLFGVVVVGAELAETGMLVLQLFLLLFELRLCLPVLEGCLLVLSYELLVLFFFFVQLIFELEADFLSHFVLALFDCAV